MAERGDLERRIAELEGQVAALRRGRFPVRGIRKRASWGIGNLPFYEVALGPDVERGELRGHAKAVFAVGGPRGLGDQWRVIYSVGPERVTFYVESITAHDYRRQ